MFHRRPDPPWVVLPSGGDTHVSSDTGGNLKIPVSFIKGRGENRQEGFQARVHAGSSHPCDVPNLMGKGHSPHPGVHTGGCTHESTFSEKVTSVGSQEGGTSCPVIPEVLLIDPKDNRKIIPVHKEFKILLRRQKYKTVCILLLNNVKEVQKKGVSLGVWAGADFMKSLGIELALEGWLDSGRQRREGNRLSYMLSP